MEAVLADLKAQTEALDGRLTALAPPRWSEESACAGWTIADVVMHLAQTEESVVAAFEHGDPGRPFAPYVERVDPAPGERPVDAMMAAAVEAERTDDHLAVHERWRNAHAAALGHLAAAEPGTRIPWVAAPLAPRTMATTRLSEHWIHHLDIAEPLGQAVADGPFLHHIARLAWRTIPYALRDAGIDEAPEVRAELAAPDGTTWTFGPEDAPLQVEGTAADWCRLAARRLPASDADVTARGPHAEALLASVRTYA